MLKYQEPSWERILSKDEMALVSGGDDEQPVPPPDDEQPFDDEGPIASPLAFTAMSAGRG